MVYCFLFITSFLRSEKKVENEWEWDWTLGSPLSCWLFIQRSTAVSAVIWKNCNLVHFCMIIVLYQRNSWVLSKTKKQIALLSVSDALGVQTYFSSRCAPFYWFTSIPMFVFATVKHIFFFSSPSTIIKFWKKSVGSMFLQKIKSPFSSCIQGGNMAGRDF